MKIVIGVACTIVPDLIYYVFLHTVCVISMVTASVSLNIFMTYFYNNAGTGSTPLVPPGNH